MKLFSRMEQRAASNLGVVSVSQGSKQSKLFRNSALDVLDSYYESRQYASLAEWDQPADSKTFVPIRQRKPRIVYNFAKVMASRITSKLIGAETFPSFRIEEDPDTEEFIKQIVKAAKLKAALLEPVRRCIVSGSVLVRYYLTETTIKVEHYLSKYCYPEFNETGELASVRIQYVYTDESEKDENGNFKKKWFRMDLGPEADIMYTNPDYQQGVSTEPPFEILETVQHGMGFVQAEWFRTVEHKHTPDGASLIADVLGFVDEFNYSLSQSSTAVAYNQDPQLVLNGIDEDELESLIRSSTKAWNLGREGKAEFLENNMTGVERAEEMRERIRLSIQDIARVVLLDPEKTVGHAQSAKAMEVLHGPLVELVGELRPAMEDCIMRLIVKIMMSHLLVARAGGNTPITIPPGYVPQSLNINVVWPPIFPMTMADLQQKVNVAMAAANASLISRETMTRYLAKDFGVDNVEEEVAKIAAQPVINPFGAF